MSTMNTFQATYVSDVTSNRQREFARNNQPVHARIQHQAPSDVRTQEASALRKHQADFQGVNYSCPARLSLLCLVEIELLTVKGTE
jgi:hypothetical protein